MTVDVVMDIAREALLLILKVSLPVLLVSMVIGLIVSIFQTVTSIQEQTLTFVPKIVAVFLGMLIFGAFILTTLTDYMTELWTNFSTFLG